MQSLNMKNLTNLFFTLALMALPSSAELIKIEFTSPSPHIANGYYMGYTEATLFTSAGTLPFQSVMCNDFYHSITVPSGPFAYSVSDLGDLTVARFQSATPAQTVKNYQIGAILLYNFDSNLGSMNDYQAGSYNTAVWRVFNSTVNPFGDSAALTAAAESQFALGAAHKPNNLAFAALRVLTPSDRSSKGPQEMLYLDFDAKFGIPDGRVPEPSTYMLLGLGLAALGLIKKRNRSASEAQQN